MPEGDGPLGVGTRLREVHRAPGGKELPSVVEVSEYEPGSAFALRVIEGTPVHLRITLEPAERRARGCASAPSVSSPARRASSQPLLARVLKRQFAGQFATLQTRLA